MESPRERTPRGRPTGPATAEAPARAPAAEARLAEACASGDVSAFEQIYQLYGTRMKSVAWNLLGNTTDAEDAVQEAFLKAYRGRGSFKGQASLATWLHRIVVNTCLDMRRRGKRHPEEPPLDPETTEFSQATTGAPHHPLRLALERSIERLSEKHRTAFVLFEVEGFSHAEIAGMLEITEAASKNRLFEAKRALREMLKRQ